MICIYNIRNLINNKIYIGSAINFNKRKIVHISRLNRNVHHSKYLQNSWNIHGKENFIFEIVEQVDNKSKLIEREQVWINFFKPEYNMNPIAGSRLGTKATKETLEKMRLSRINYKVSEETKKKISESKLGKPLSKEHIKKLSISAKNRVSSFLGKTHSEYSKNKIRSKKLGVFKKHPKLSKTILQYDKNGIFIREWEYVTKISRELNIHRNSISNNLSGRAKTAGKFIFKYK